MKVELLFPAAIVTLFVGAALVYLYKGDTNKFLYSAGAALINFVAFFPIARLPWAM